MVASLLTHMRPGGREPPQARGAGSAASKRAEWHETTALIHRSGTASAVRAFEETSLAADASAKATSGKFEGAGSKMGGRPTSAGHPSRERHRGAQTRGVPKGGT